MIIPPRLQPARQVELAAFERKPRPLALPTRPSLPKPVEAAYVGTWMPLLSSALIPVIAIVLHQFYLRLSPLLFAGLALVLITLRWGWALGKPRLRTQTLQLQANREAERQSQQNQKHYYAEILPTWERECTRVEQLNRETAARPSQRITPNYDYFWKSWHQGSDWEVADSRAKILLEKARMNFLLP